MLDAQTTESDRPSLRQEEPIHILVPLTSAELGGGQMFLLKLIDALPISFKFSAWLFEHGPMETELEHRHVPFQVLPDSSTHTIRGLWQLREKLKTEQPSLIYLHASRLIALLAKTVGIPCVERINMSRLPEVGGWCNRLPWLDRIMTGWNTKVIAVSDAIRQQLLKRGVSNNKIEVIRNFVNTEKLHRPELRHPMRKQLGIPPEAIVIVNVGRMVPQKGQSDFLRVAAQCLPQNERFYFLLVGDGSLREELEQQAKQLGLANSARFTILPFQKEIECIYAASDILLHTAHWDPLANVLLEAMAAGLAVVATDVDGTREVITRDCGILVPPATPESWVNILLHLGQDLAERKRLGEAAHQQALAISSPQKVLEQYRSLFSDL